jgi:hypothetical protein
MAVDTRPALSAEGVYGTILTAAIVFAASTNEESTWNVFWIVLGTTLVLWAAHVYAETVAAHGRTGDTVMTLRQSFLVAQRHSAGLLYSAIIPLLLLMLGNLGIVDEDLAVDLALWSAVIVLAVLGYRAYRDRGSSMLVKIIGALATGAFGGAIILLNALIH